MTTYKHKDTQQIVEVHEQCDEHHNTVFYASGGGFRMRMPMDSFSEQFAEYTPSNEYVPSRFGIEGVDLYEGVHIPDRKWNGWSLPFFTKEVFSSFLHEDEPNEHSYQLNWDDNEYYDPHEEAWLPLSTITYEGETYFTIDGFCWDDVGLEPDISPR